MVERGRLAGRIAVITGSGRGIGRATAELFAHEGASLILVDCDADANSELARGLCAAGASAEAYALDVADGEALAAFTAAAVERHPRIDVLFNNAGAVEFAPVAAADDRHWHRMIDVNLHSAFVLIRELRPALIGAPAASVINNASVDGLRGHPYAPVYSAAKGAMITLTRALAFELGGAGIRINCIAPGAIDTEMTAQVPEPVRDEVRRLTPLGRLGSSREVAEVVLFLACDASSFITGETLTVDGGRNALTVGSLGPSPSIASTALAEASTPSRNPARKPY